MQFVFNLKNHTASTLVTTANLSGGVFIEALCDLAYEVETKSSWYGDLNRSSARSSAGVPPTKPLSEDVLHLYVSRCDDDRTSTATARHVMPRQQRALLEVLCSARTGTCRAR